jgi:hypothetical protein
MLSFLTATSTRHPPDGRSAIALGHSNPLRLRPEILVGLKRWAAKKLRKGAAKALKSLGRVNLCAGRLMRPSIRRTETFGRASARQRRLRADEWRVLSTPSSFGESGRTTVES